MPQQSLFRLAQEIINLEKDLEKAQKNFTQVVLESTANIHFFSLKFELCIQEVLSSKNERVSTNLEFTDISGKQAVANRNIQLLQKELEKCIVNSSISIKRSLMKFSNLLSYNNLLFLPFCELKECYKQLCDKKSDIPKLNTQIVKPQLSYAEAFQSIEEISAEIEQIKKGISSLTEEPNTLDSTMLDYLNIVTNEYKMLPQLSASH